MSSGGLLLPLYLGCFIRQIILSQTCGCSTLLKDICDRRQSWCGQSCRVRCLARRLPDVVAWGWRLWGGGCTSSEENHSKQVGTSLDTALRCCAACLVSWIQTVPKRCFKNARRMHGIYTTSHSPSKSIADDVVCCGRRQTRIL